MKALKDALQEGLDSPLVRDFNFDKYIEELKSGSKAPMSMEEYEAEIDQALEDSKNERVIKATDLKAKINKKYS
ncbi:hypothetical protein [Wenyingzhuangia sp. IMCC45574]